MAFATLLLPYFEVDLSNPSGTTTLFSINNASASAAVAHVTLWTDESIPTLESWQLSAHYEPAAGGRVGGDWYDAYELPDGRLIVLLGDVAGHGIAAAGTAPGNAVTQQVADRSLNHRWDIVPAENGYFKLINANSGLVLGTQNASRTAGATALQWGDNLTRDNVMKQAANLKNFHTELMLPGIMVNTGPDDYFPIEQMQLMKFNGEAWELFGDVITGEVGH